MEVEKARERERERKRDTREKNLEAFMKQN